MTRDLFHERETGEEAKYKHDEELRFKAHARRDKLLGLWAAQRMGIEDEAERQAYAREVVTADFQHAGDDDVIAKVLGDLRERGIETDEAEVRDHLARLYVLALDQVQNEYPAALDRDHSPVGG